MENSAIEWTDHTFNPWRGCTKVSAGCANCYADRQSKRNPKTLGIWGPHGTRIVAAEAQWKKPLQWNAEDEKTGNRARVFCASLADVFEDWNGPIRNAKGESLATFGGGYRPALTGDDFCLLTMNDVRRRLFALIDETPWLDWLIVTKRPENIRKFWVCKGDTDGDGGCGACHLGQCQYRKNVWLMTSVENQEQADKRIPELLNCRQLSPVLGLSCEPLLGRLNMADYFGTHYVDPEDGYSECGDLPYNHGIDWVIAGGESGTNARPMHPDWARSLRDQCQDAGVPFFFKQWGEFFTSSIVDGKPHFRQFRSYSHWTAKAPTWVRGGVCLNTSGQILETGKDFMSARDDGLFPVTVLDRVGKKQAGRLLDGREWSEFPSVSQEVQV